MRAGDTSYGADYWQEMDGGRGAQDSTMWEVMRTPLQRWWSLVDVTPGCWFWLGGLNAKGYGQFHDGGPILAHRYGFNALVGPLDDEDDLDHQCHDSDCQGGICEHRKCVRPDHLVTSSTRANVLRGLGPSAVNAAKTKCAYGHEFTPENTYVDPRGWRQCRPCRSRRERAR